jgi:hypothetical protein
VAQQIAVGRRPQLFDDDQLLSSFVLDAGRVGRYSCRVRGSHLGGQLCL